MTGAMKVLVVEDEALLARSLARGLRAEGIAVDLAHDGITGRDAALRGHYDVVVLDIMLPGLQGYRVLQETRASRRLGWTAAAAPDPAAGPGDATIACVTGAMKVLVVEDEALLARSLARGLRAEGIAVDLAHDGITGRDAALRGHYDVVVLDIMLPGLQGYRVLQEIRAADVATPVLMLTAKDGEYDEADAFDLGADDYLTKPFSFVVLVARLKALARRGATARPGILRAGDLAVDLARRRVTRSDVEIALTPREFAVLEHLVRNPDITLSKSSILRAVWDEDFDGDLNIVEIYISYLRRKIDTPFGRNSIRTVRGAGYLFSPDGG